MRRTELFVFALAWLGMVTLLFAQPVKSHVTMSELGCIPYNENSSFDCTPILNQWGIDLKTNRIQGTLDLEGMLWGIGDDNGDGICLDIGRFDESDMNPGSGTRRAEVMGVCINGGGGSPVRAYSPLAWNHSSTAGTNGATVGGFVYLGNNVGTDTMIRFTGEGLRLDSVRFYGSKDVVTGGSPTPDWDLKQPTYAKYGLQFRDWDAIGGGSSSLGTGKSYMSSVSFNHCDIGMTMGLPGDIQSNDNVTIDNFYADNCYSAAIQLGAQQAVNVTIHYLRIAGSQGMDGIHVYSGGQLYIGHLEHIAGSFNSQKEAYIRFLSPNDQRVNGGVYHIAHANMDGTALSVAGADDRIPELVHMEAAGQNPRFIFGHVHYPNELISQPEFNPETGGPAVEALIRMATLRGQCMLKVGSGYAIPLNSIRGYEEGTTDRWPYCIINDSVLGQGYGSGYGAKTEHFVSTDTGSGAHINSSGCTTDTFVPFRPVLIRHTKGSTVRLQGEHIEHLQDSPSGSANSWWVDKANGNVIKVNAPGDS